ncbi:MAG: prepilin-type N-terminal cleavage/methylation domain-containing protein [Deltaproteobacteria bacterium]|nr:prepilin-type N-terminal cleavage/methylation domain-containing protein [Deltaproteobacteria bacterium]
MQRTQVAQYSRQETGFSLIEMMIALFILTVAVLGLLELTITSIKTNMQNDMRNASIRLTSQTAEILLALPIDSVATCGLTPDASGSNYNSLYTYSASNTCLYTSDYARYPNPSQAIRSGTVNYNIYWSVSSPTNDIRQITITVSYFYRGQQYSNTAVIYKHRAV